MSERPSFEEMCTELDELAAVPTDVLAAWVTDRGRCLWESTFGDPPEWTGEDELDRELATHMCAGCPVRAECLELELRVGGAETVGVWGALNEDVASRWSWVIAKPSGSSPYWPNALPTSSRMPRPATRSATVSMPVTSSPRLVTTCSAGRPFQARPWSKMCPRPSHWVGHCRGIAMTSSAPPMPCGKPCTPVTASVPGVEHRVHGIRAPSPSPRSTPCPTRPTTGPCGSVRPGRATACIRDLRDAGVRVAFGSDWPLADFDPRGTAPAAQLRRRGGAPERSPIQPDQAITARMALEGYTTHATWSVGEQDEAGSIKVGKRADLTAFAADPLLAPPDELVEAPIMLTVADGAVTHEALVEAAWN